MERHNDILNDLSDRDITSSIRRIIARVQHGHLRNGSPPLRGSFEDKTTQIKAQKVYSLFRDDHGSRCCISITLVTDSSCES
jgi:hypothetical protein